MKLAMLGMVMRAKEALDRLNAAIAAVELGYVSIVIGGIEQEEALVAVAKATLLTELTARQASLIRDLEAWGVKVD